MRTVAFILEQFELASPGQQLLDRLLIGYNQDGEFKPTGARVIVSLPGAGENRLIKARAKEFGLVIAESMESALGQADFAILVPGGVKFQEPSPGAASLENVLSSLSPGKAVYVDGALLLGSSGRLNAVRQLSETRSVQIACSRAAAHLIPLPVRPSLPTGDKQKLLIVVQGVFPEAELDALFAIKPYLAPAWTENNTPRVTRFENADLWNFAYSTAWRPLLQAAISRSDNIKGDPERDGRTQDIVGLRLIEKLAPKAHAWHLQHTSGLEIALLVLDGALTDCNFAVEARGQIHSAQLYRPQAPMDDHYNDLAAWITDCFTKAPVRGNLREALFISGIIDAMRQERSAVM